MKNNNYKGVFTAIITPFDNGKVDYSSLENIINQQTKSGVSGIVVAGTTGESATLTNKEQKEVINFCVKKAKSIKVIAGTGSNSTAESISMTQYAEKVGAKGCLLVNPYYNKPGQQGLVKHFKEIANSVSLDIFLYNIPSRTNVSFTEESLIKLSKIKNIVALKDATGNIDYTSNLVKNINLNIFSGNDNMNFPILTMGGSGIISVLANIYPYECSLLCQLLDAKESIYDVQKARELHFIFWEMVQILFEETNPIYIKEACTLKNIIKSNQIRMPLTNLSKEKKKNLINIIKTTDRKMELFLQKNKFNL